ncbi:MAG: hypothetical protein ACK419_08025, partial [Pyrinomonadaceae bacterium]
MQWLILEVSCSSQIIQPRFGLEGSRVVQKFLGKSLYPKENSQTNAVPVSLPYKQAQRRSDFIEARIRPQG